MPKLKTLLRDDQGVLLAISAVSSVLTLIGYVATIDWSTKMPSDGTTMVVGRDFFNFWMYGRAALTPDPGRYYDFSTYVTALVETLGRNSAQSWSYPPSIMLVAAPFGLLPYFIALLLWSVLAIGTFAWTAQRYFGDIRMVALALLSPAAIFCYMSGQSAMLTCAMVLGIFTLLDCRPVLAGILIGTLTLKPQLGLMFPFMLLASGRWRVFGVATLTVLVIALATALAFGPQVWVQYVLQGIPTQSWVLKDAEMLGAPFMPTIFMNARQLGLSYEQALGVQAVFSAAAVATLCWAFWKHGDGDKTLLFALFAACSVCGSPYLLSYDLMPLTCAVLALMVRGLDPLGQRLAFALFWLTMIQMTLGSAHIAGPALLVPVFVGWLARQLAAKVPRQLSVAA